MTVSLLDFYSGTGTDNRGRRLLEILSWDDEQLESSHDYIQWVFPLIEISHYNPSAPILNRKEIAEFQNSAELQSNALKAFQRMLKFYGFEFSDMNGFTQITPSIDHKYRLSNWVQKWNHNHLRITRILKFLCLINLHEYAEAFLSILEKVSSNNPQVFSAETLEFWRRAVQDTV